MVPSTDHLLKTLVYLSVNTVGIVKKKKKNIQVVNILLQVL